jgi:hypothetical protein
MQPQTRIGPAADSFISQKRYIYNVEAVKETRDLPLLFRYLCCSSPAHTWYSDVPSTRHSHLCDHCGGKARSGIPPPSCSLPFFRLAAEAGNHKPKLA